MKVYTRQGDAGSSNLIGKKERVSKAKPVFEILGAIDEVNAVLGCAVSLMKKNNERDLLENIQKEMFEMGAYVAGLKPSQEKIKLWTGKTHNFEKLMDAYDAKLPELKAFVIPGGNEPSSLIHLARVKVRTLERLFVSYLGNRAGKLVFLLPYLNRLSDLLFVLARFVSFKEKKSEKIWRME